MERNLKQLNLNNTFKVNIVYDSKRGFWYNIIDADMKGCTIGQTAILTKCIDYINRCTKLLNWERDALE